MSILLVSGATLGYVLMALLVTAVMAFYYSYKNLSYCDEGPPHIVCGIMWPLTIVVLPLWIIFSFAIRKAQSVGEEVRKLHNKS